MDGRTSPPGIFIREWWYVLEMFDDNDIDNGFLDVCVDIFVWIYKATIELFLVLPNGMTY